MSSPVRTRSTPTPNQPAPLSFLAPPVTQWLTAGLGLLWEGRVGAFGVGLSLRMCVLLGGVTGILSCTLGRLKSKEP